MARRERFWLAGGRGAKVQLELSLGMVVTVRLESAPYVLVLTFLGLALSFGTGTKDVDARKGQVRTEEHARTAASKLSPGGAVMIRGDLSLWLGVNSSSRQAVGGQ